MSDQPSDLDLAAAVASTVAEPRVESADSFVLHAPLELLARFALLPRVSPHVRDEARARIEEIGTTYEAFSAGVGEAAAVEFDDAHVAADALVGAIGAGDRERADAVGAWVGRTVDPQQLAPLLGDALVPLLGAAGHAPIFLASWPRVSPRRELTGEMLRPLVRSLCEYPERRISWIDEVHRAGSPATAPGSLFEVLASTSQGGAPVQPFIHPVMSAVDHERTAARVAPVTLAAPDVRTAAVDVLRVAAWTMVQEPGGAAPYLWSHCLTMPLAVVSLLRGADDPHRMLAVAATHVTGFRSAFATGPLRTAAPQPLAGTPGVQLDEGQETAVRTAWHVPPEGRAALVTELVDRAARHHDAHLVKYTLACLDAIAFDPSGARLYLTAAASLAAWWSEADRLGDAAA